MLDLEFSLCPHRNLLSLKHYEGNVEDLDLNFTTISSEFGQSKVKSVSQSLIVDRAALMESLLQVVELRRGGADMPVTRDNCVQYIHLLAHWRLNVSIERQFRAFREGLASVVPLQWLRLFNQGELQVQLSIQYTYMYVAMDCICMCSSLGVIRTGADFRSRGTN